MSIIEEYEWNTKLTLERFDVERRESFLATIFHDCFETYSFPVSCKRT